MHLFRTILPNLLLLLIPFALMSQPSEKLKLPMLTDDQRQVDRIFEMALKEGQCYQNLEHLCKKIGARLSGSPEAGKAVSWGQNVLNAMQVDSVWLQECMVPHWVRGKDEKAFILQGGKQMEVPICALGGSIGTGEKGIKANVVEVQQFKELGQLGKEGLEGKIVFYNRPMPPELFSCFEAYGNTVDQRWAGAMQAAPYGAVGVIVRSMALRQDDYPHTGSMGYNDTITKIPAAAISTNGANLLSDQLKKDPNLEFSFNMNCETLPDEKSYNVIGEIKGSEFPDEIILVGGHLDSWDAGEGAHDDGAGCVQSMEVLRLIKALGIQPKRTIRCVLFMNEENGGRGADKYAELAKANGEKHIAAIETDAGGFTPHGFGVKGDSQTVGKISKWRPLLQKWGVYDISKGHGGADINKLDGQGDVVLIGLHPDSQRYFDYHHADSDVFEAVNERELELGAGALTALVYLISEYGL